MRWGVLPLSEHLEPHCLGVVGGPAMPERGCRSSSVIQDKRPLIWLLRAVIEVMRVRRSLEEGSDIIKTGMVGGGTRTLIQGVLEVVSRVGALELEGSEC